MAQDEALLQFTPSIQLSNHKTIGHHIVPCYIAHTANPKQIWHSPQSKQQQRVKQAMDK